MDEKGIFISKILSLHNLSQKSWDVKFSKFLTLTEQALAKEELLRVGAHFTFCSCDRDAERKLLAVFPYEDFSLANEDVPIEAVKIAGSTYREFSNRDILGSLMSLGLSRDVIGDIVISEDKFSAYVFVYSGISEYIISELFRVANDKVKCEVCSICDVPSIEKKFEFISTTSASLRADALISSFLNISRETVCKLILSGSVMINHVLLDKKEKECIQNDIFSVRGYGRFELCEIGGLNRKNRIRVKIKKYI